MADLSPISIFTSLFEGLNVPLPIGYAPKSVGALITAVTTLLASINFTNDIKVRPNSLTATQPQSYDFIVVGSGSAGGIIANRLSENGAFQVLLLEAGGDPTTLNQLPYLQSENLGHPETDWVYRIKPQTNSCLALIDNGMIWNRGKSLGGSTNLNFMAYMRGNSKDFDSWAELTKDPQWSYDNLLPFFKKSENYHGNFPENVEYHGADGPLWISSSQLQPLAKEWLAAAQEVGYSVQDPNTRQTSAFSSVDFNIRNGKRSEVYDGFIKPAFNRPNLHIKRYALVTKIIVDSNKKATGVEYVRHGEKVTATASKEVVVSAGAIGSPQLLMLSGIGPVDHLKFVEIEPILDLPGVGQNLMDHAGVILGPFLLNDSVSFIQDRNLSSDYVADYVKDQKGAFGSSLVSGVGMISTTNDTDWPNIGMFQFSMGIGEGTPSFFEKVKHVKSGVMQKYYEGHIGKDAVTCSVNQELPFSRGSITLRSNDPLEPPIIDPNYFSDPRDLESMVAAFRLAVKMYEETKTWQKFNATLMPNHFPGCEGHTLKTDSYYECYIRHFTATNWHYGSTCKMGVLNDPMAVVDSKLKVIGISNLRIADASIMPQITNANLNAPTLMIGEKAADLILQAWAN